MRTGIASAWSCALGLALSVALAACTPEQVADPAIEPDVSGNSAETAAEAANAPESGQGGIAPDDDSEIGEQQPNEDETAIRRFLNVVFGSYALGDAMDPKLRPETAFEPELEARLEALIDASMEIDGVYHDALSYDPICYCQDFGDFSHEVIEVDVDGETATALIRQSNFGEVSERTIDLVRTPKGWRIYDLDGEFRAMAMTD